MSKPKMDIEQPGWLKKGVSGGWIGIYELELLHFLERRYGPLTSGQKGAVVFASLFLAQGHSCLPLDRTPEEWVELLDLEPEVDVPEIPAVSVRELHDFPAVGEPGEGSLFTVDGNRFFIRRYWYYEQFAAQKIRELTSIHPEVYPSGHVSKLLDRHFPSGEGEEPDYQKAAAALALNKRFLLVSGGPGTGKTTTVARILAILAELSEKPLRVALAAPTGKASVRMAEALQLEMENLQVDPSIRDRIPAEAKTLHRLLWNSGSGDLLPPYREFRLPCDLVIVDEVSMMDLSLLYRLMRSLDNHTRLIMLGDRDQLASVEAGSVLGDICRKRENRFRHETANLLKSYGIQGKLPVGDQGMLEDSILYLTKNYRFDEESGIAALAAAVNRQDPEEASLILETGRFSDLSFEKFDYSADGFQRIYNEMAEKVAACQGKTPEEMLQIWSGSVWLTVLRSGPFGTEALNRMVEEHLARHRIITANNGWYAGRPVLVTRNDYALGIFNGDLGVCTMDAGGVPIICFPGSRGIVKRISAHRIREFEPAFLLTVHKSQGSEFGHVTLLLPGGETPVMTKELLYTAVTRARNRCTLLGETRILKQGILRESTRFTGLRTQLFEKS